MTEVRSLFKSNNSNNNYDDDDDDRKKQYGLFATMAYREGDTILIESPLVILASSSLSSSTTSSGRMVAAAAAAADSIASIQAQFLPSAMAVSSSSFMTLPESLILPSTILSKYSKVLFPNNNDNNNDNNNNEEEKERDYYWFRNVTNISRMKILRKMIVVLANYSILHYHHSLDNTEKKGKETTNTFSQLLKLYHPIITTTTKGESPMMNPSDNIDNDDNNKNGKSRIQQPQQPPPPKQNHPEGGGEEEEEEVAIIQLLAKLAITCCEHMCAPNSDLHNLLLQQQQQQRQQRRQQEQQNSSGSSSSSSSSTQRLTTINNNDDKDDDLLLKILLIYSCNAFEGGRIYPTISRINHSCNPNAVVLEGSGGGSESGPSLTIPSTFTTEGGGGVEDTVSNNAHSFPPESNNNNNNNSNRDVSILKAACDIAPGEEITISYLGRYIFAGYPVRQQILHTNKHFICRCSRCRMEEEEEDGTIPTVGVKEKMSGGGGERRRISDTGSGWDMASRIPCPICHPRSGRYLDEDVMLDEYGGNDDSDAQGWTGFQVSYSIPKNGLTPQERSMYCPSCKKTVEYILPNNNGSSMRKKKEGLAIKYMCMAEEKVYERLECIHKTKKASKEDGTTDSEQDEDEEDENMDRQYLQMAMPICGSRHWTTHFMNLHIMEESLASIHSIMMSVRTKKENAQIMEDVYMDIAEAADSLEKAYQYASSLGLHMHSAHWLFDYTIALAQTLVGLGDVKSQKYGSAWIQRIAEYAEKFENETMKKIVIALRDAWMKGKDHEDTDNVDNQHGIVDNENNDSKRRRIA